MIEIHPELARGMLESLPAGTALLDDRDRLIWANTKFAELCGTELPALVGRHALDFGVLLPEKRTDDHADVCTMGKLYCISRPFEDSGRNGRLLFVVDRADVLKSHLNTLVGSSMNGMTSRGLLPRSALITRFDAEISRTRRYSNPLSCLVLRTPEDQPNGLEPFVPRLREHLRWVDVLGNWDPRTIVVVLPETRGSAAAKIREKLAPSLVGLLQASNLDVLWGDTGWSEGDTPSTMVNRALEAAHPARAVAS